MYSPERLNDQLKLKLLALDVWPFPRGYLELIYVLPLGRRQAMVEERRKRKLEEDVELSLQPSMTCRSAACLHRRERLNVRLYVRSGWWQILEGVGVDRKSLEQVALRGRGDDR
jgi:hypothetical protein